MLPAETRRTMTHAPAILVPLADGFEEVEAVAIVDVLRRADLEVVTAALEGTVATGAHGLRIETDAALGELDLGRFGALVLPGGMPGTTHLAEDGRVLGLVRSLVGEGGTVAAICAAPLVLAAAGVLEGHAFTHYPGITEGLPRGASEARVVVSEPLVTSRGPGTALEFALALVERFRGAEKAAELERAMLVARPR